MSAGELRVGQVVPFDLTLYDQNEEVMIVTGGTFKVRITDPNGASSDRPATLVNDGTDGLITFTTTGTDFKYTGIHRFQAFATLSGVEYPFDIFEETIHENLPPGP